MMRVLLTILLLSCTVVHGEVPKWQSLRVLYYSVAEDKTSPDRLLEAADVIGVDAYPVVLGYRGVGLMLKASHGYNPFSKLSYFNKGKAALEKALARDSENVELVFLRFCIQTNVPSFLYYNGDIANDKRRLLISLKGLSDQDLKDRIKSYLLKSRYCSVNEKADLL